MSSRLKTGPSSCSRRHRARESARTTPHAGGRGQAPRMTPATNTNGLMKTPKWHGGGAADDVARRQALEHL